MDTKIAKMDPFTRAYIECLLWSECDPETGENFQDYSVGEIEVEGLAQIIEDCRAFQETAGAAIDEDPERAGHDFCLSRNGHGAGFWDSIWGDVPGRILHDIAKPFGTQSLLPTGDGKLCVGG